MSDGRNIGIHLVPGDLLAGGYKITRCISSSVTGAIYLAEDLNFARHPVTVKEMPGVFTREPPLVTKDNFKREFEALFKLDHPSILKIYKKAKESPPLLAVG